MYLGINFQKLVLLQYIGNVLEPKWVIFFFFFVVSKSVSTLVNAFFSDKNVYLYFRLSLVKI